MGCDEVVLSVKLMISVGLIINTRYNVIKNKKTQGEIAKQDEWNRKIKINQRMKCVFLIWMSEMTRKVCEELAHA